MKLLYLSPGNLQLKAARQLQRFLVEQWDTPQARKALLDMKVRDNGSRWYDEDHETAQTVELLKNSPDFLKTRVADTLLEILMAESA